MKLEARPNYPYVTRSLIRLYNQGALTNIKDIVVEPDYGYICRINYKNGGHRIVYGTDLGLNPGSASALARDKGHSKFILNSLGVDCPKGEEFLLPWWVSEIKQTQEKLAKGVMRTADMAAGYVKDNLGYPVYVKPVSGSKGSDIFKVFSERELAEVLELYNQKRIRVAVIEEFVDLPDYRIVLLDNKLISAYRRIPPTVMGNGTSTIRQLIMQLQLDHKKDARVTKLELDDPRVVYELARQNYSLDDILPANEEIRVLPVSNLSIGGSSQDVTENINASWVELASRVADNFGLRLIGLDLACSDITRSDSEYRVIEVNSAPGLDNYALSGPKQKQIVDSLYAKVFNTEP